jgi:hypothetical protein
MMIRSATVHRTFQITRISENVHVAIGDTMKTYIWDYIPRGLCDETLEEKIDLDLCIVILIIDRV